MSLFATTIALLLAGVPDPFAIEVVDDQTGRGVPLIELETVNNIRFVTDSNGLAAIIEPDLMGQSIYFHVRGHGYEFPKDGFGFRGKALRVEPGGHARLEIHRNNIAERLYRVTGGGIYSDSVLLDHPVPIREPLLDAQVFGSDSVVNAVYHGKVHWFWGDTNRPSYPLGNFHVPGATSLLPEKGGLDPEVGINLTYEVDEKDFARATAKMPGEGPTWIGGLFVLRDDEGRERMFASYVKVRNFLEVYERGLVVFNDETHVFDKVTTFEMEDPLHPDGHAFQRTEDGVEYVYFATPYPLTRVRAHPDDVRNPARYEAFTCLKAGSRGDQAELDRDESGKLRYSWKVNTPYVGPELQEKLIRQGKLQPGEAILALRDVETGEPVRAHGGSVYWNENRKRWVMITVESGGSTSFLGEVWYAEADTPTGPWVYARKVVTHDRYSFYNPKQHPMFDKEGGRILFFEGTYTHTFSGNPDQTPRYDYNQVLYKLDLDDPRLNLPVVIRDPETSDPLGFFAFERPAPGTVAIVASRDNAGDRVLRIASSDDIPGEKAIFHAFPADMADPPSVLVPLYEFRDKDNHRTFAPDAPKERPDLRRSKRPLCLVWPDPIRVALPSP